MFEVLSIMCGVVGLCYFWDVILEASFVSGIIMAVGFSLDNSCHYVHSFSTAPFQTRKERNLFALNLVGLPILYGDITTAVPTTKSYEIVAFFPWPTIMSRNLNETIWKSRRISSNKNVIYSSWRCVGKLCQIAQYRVRVSVTQLIVSPRRG